MSCPGAETRGLHLRFIHAFAHPFTQTCPLIVSGTENLDCNFPSPSQCSWQWLVQNTTQLSPHFLGQKSKSCRHSQKGGKEIKKKKKDKNIERMTAPAGRGASQAVRDGEVEGTRGDIPRFPLGGTVAVTPRHESSQTIIKSKTARARVPPRG